MPPPNTLAPRPLESPHAAWARGVALQVKKVQSGAADERSESRLDLVRQTFAWAKKEAGADWPTRRKFLKRQFALGIEPMEPDEAPKAPKAEAPVMTVDLAVRQLKELCRTPGEMAAASEKLKKAGFSVYVDVAAPAPTVSRVGTPAPSVAPVSVSAPAAGGDAWTVDLAPFFARPQIPLQPAQVNNVLAECLKTLKELCESAQDVHRYYEEVKDPASAPTVDASHWGQFHATARQYFEGKRGVDYVRQEIGRVAIYLNRFHFVPEVVKKSLCGESVRLVAPSLIEREVEPNVRFTQNKGEQFWLKYRALWDTHGFERATPESRYWGAKFAEAVLAALSGASVAQGRGSYGK